MRPCPTHPLVPRTWTVELRPHPGGPTLHCHRCTTTGQHPGAPAGRPAALAHLAGHARRDKLPAHLRTCQCHERGCRWHPRHRGCAGAVLLVLAQERGGRVWRLADVCAACAAATPHAAVVPDTAHLAQRSARPGSMSRLELPERVLVRDTLASLHACLPEDVGAPARLLAVQCALRAGPSGRLALPAGLLRGMRLGSTLTPWCELEDAHWLMRLTSSAGPVWVQLLSHHGPHPARHHRARAADWTLRTAREYGADDYDPNTALMALALAACRSPHAAQSPAEREVLSRARGLTPVELTRAVSRLRAGSLADQ